VLQRVSTLLWLITKTHLQGFFNCVKMAKELPYFRFTVQDWQNGKISLESNELKGFFIDVCGYYWINDCNLTLAILNKKFSNATNLLKQLIELDIIKHENRHDKVEIDFLNIQYDLLSEKRKLRQSAGSKGGNAKAMLKQKGSYKDKDKDNNKDNLQKPVKCFFKDSIYFDKLKFKEAFPEWQKDKLAYYYEQVNTWSNEGNKKVDWKATVRTWANRDEKEGKIKFASKNNNQIGGLLT
jgi:hypothetical protein